ncbi:lysosomal acid lipase:cholesteryl ester [Echinococcus multilocularis]|uniref:Lipase n=1 Tax=Echinococcus multilocularis TaxID=6211 RepID=U6HMV9_ECHMU|nr:lysosomal acid lipase:cholesteryl ester [Echinococcus multilocularis]
MLIACAVILFHLSSGSCHKSVFGAVDPEVFQTAYEIIDGKGYRPNEYIVETEDGYYLTLHRIRTKTSMSMGDSRSVVLLQHGFLDSAHTWINNLANESLGFILADAGFDVWLGNSRGSTYSQKHAYLNTSDDKFWAFSWDEMAMYDLRASIDFIINETKVDKIFYVGHSQGAQIALAQLNSDASLRGHVSAFAALAPVAYLEHVRSPIRYIAPLCNSLHKARWLFGGVGRFLPSDWVMRFFALFVCRDHPLPFVCKNLIFLFAGYDTRDINSTRLPVYVAHTPAGTSVQNMVHYCQGMWQGRFQAFDFGAAENVVKYNRTTPPPYGLDAVGVPVTVYWGGKDWLAPPRDIGRILVELSRGSGAQVRDVYLSDYNHLDFVWGLDAASRIYRDIIHFFRQYQ